MSTNDLKGVSLPLALLALLVGVSACVDHDYDLGEVDMTVTIGGDSLMVPSSGTEELTMDRILDITEGGCVRVADQGEYGMDEGDFYVHAGNGDAPSQSTIVMEGLAIGGTTVGFDLQSVPQGEAELSFSQHFTMGEYVGATFVEIDEAVTQCHVSLAFSATAGEMTLGQGFSLGFPSFFRLEKDPSDANASAYSIEGSTLTLAQPMALPATLSINATGLDLASASDGEVSFERGDRSLGTRGYIELQGDVAASGPVSATVESALSAQVTIGDITFQQLYGIVDPEISVNMDPLYLNDIPDVLSDEDTNLDWTNPQFYLSIGNPTNMTVDFSNITLDACYDHEAGTVVHEFTMGTGMPNTIGTVTVAPNTAETGYVLCLSQMGAPIGVDNDVVVTDLADIIRQVPNRLEFPAIEAHAVQERCWVDLDRVYEMDVNYNVVAPLSFGEALVISYKDTIAGWREDLRKIERIDELQARFTLTNKVPLELTLSAVALDVDGREIPGEEISCAVTPSDRTIAQGTVASPVASEVTVDIAARDGDISRLDGILVTLTSTKGDSSGVTINRGQSIRLDNIRLLLLGGVTLDLN